MPVSNLVETNKQLKWGSQSLQSAQPLPQPVDSQLHHVLDARLHVDRVPHVLHVDRCLVLAPAGALEVQRGEGVDQLVNASLEGDVGGLEEVVFFLDFLHGVEDHSDGTGNVPAVVVELVGLDQVLHVVSQVIVALFGQLDFGQEVAYHFSQFLHVELRLLDFPQGGDQENHVIVLLGLPEGHFEGDGASEAMSHQDFLRFVLELRGDVINKGLRLLQHVLKGGHIALVPALGPPEVEEVQGVDVDLIKFGGRPGTEIGGISAVAVEAVQVEDQCGRLGMEDGVVVVEGMLPEGEAMAVRVVFLVDQGRPLGGARSGQDLGDDLRTLFVRDDREMSLVVGEGRNSCHYREWDQVNIIGSLLECSEISIAPTTPPPNRRTDQTRTNAQDECELIANFDFLDFLPFSLAVI